jgi:glucose/arabinose dehydrogenase
VGSTLQRLVALVPAVAQAPDCTGISDVSDFDGDTVSDLEGQLAAVLVVEGLTLPVFVTSPPGDTDRLFIVEQNGLIKIRRDGAVLGTPFLDVTAITQSPSDGGHIEEGLLGLAFHPDYDSNGYFFIYHTVNGGDQHVVARHKVSANPDVADPGIRDIVLTVDHPDYGDQNGGMLAFSPIDGYLYIATGDGGGECDPPDNGQNKESNLGKLLRLNVDALPASTAGNPYDGEIPGNDEIWSYGLRNGWRFSFDRIGGEMLLGDVGESVWEEIDCQKPDSVGGENYGWKRYEGPQCPSPSTASCSTPGSCMIPGYKSPKRVYDHATAGFSCSVIGGYVYRGCRMSDLHGTYFYADYCSALINTFRVDADCVTVPAGPTIASDIERKADLAPPGTINLITSFGEDEQGELYVLSRTGKVFKIMPRLGIMEVSGANASSLVSLADGSMVWEDLERTSDHPISSYKVYRSEDPDGTFTCVHLGTETSWSGGDPEDPDSGAGFYYVVTALNATGEETRAGNRSDGTPRDVSVGSNCP